MDRYRRYFFLAAGGLLLAGCAAPDAPALETHSARIARVEAGLLPGEYLEGQTPEPMQLADRMEHYGVPGVSVTVVDDGAIAWAKGYGVLESGRAEAVTPETLFQAASISKPVAAVTALRLVEDGVLNLDGDVNTQLTSWRVPDNEFTREEKVTLRRLLSHTAGLTVHGFSGYEAGADVPAVGQILDGVEPANSGPVRVDVVPGSEYRYSGGGYTVAQQLMIDVAGRPFPELAASLVLEPAGMSASAYQQPLATAFESGAAAGHRANGDLVRGRWHTYPELAAAGLWTTPTDLVRFALAVSASYLGEDGALLKQRTARQMLTPVRDDYGLGFALGGDGDTLWFSHGGANEGYRCQLTMFATTGDGAAIMTNSDRGGALARELMLAIAREYGWPEHEPRVRTTVRLTTQQLESCAGRYRFSPRFVVTVRAGDGRLLIHAPGDVEQEYHPESETRFFTLAEGPPVEFVKDGEGTVVVMRAAGNEGRRVD